MAQTIIYRYVKYILEGKIGVRFKIYQDKVIKGTPSIKGPNNSVMI